MLFYIRAQKNTIVNFFVYYSAHTDLKKKNRYLLSQFSFSVKKKKLIFTNFSMCFQYEKIKKVLPSGCGHDIIKHDLKISICLME